MIDAETELLIAVAERVKAQLGLKDAECEVGLEDVIPAVAGHRFVIVQPAGVQAGPNHRGSGGAIDLYLSVRVIVYHRMSEVPRDRRTSVFLDRSRGINKDLAAVARAIDFRYEPLAVANTALGQSAGSGFVEPLRMTGFDGKPQAISGEVFDATRRPAQGREPWLAMKRGVNFQYARFCQTR